MEFSLTQSTLEETCLFEDLPLSKITLKALKKAGYQQATPIQAAVIPEVLSDQDVVGQAQTGTGKTAAFLLPILERFANNEEKTKDPKALVLVPTRELADQVMQEAIKLSTGKSFRIAVLCGGRPIGRQIRQLQSGVELVVGTPGRVMDHLRRGTLQCRHLGMVVLDEADRMLDIGFRPDIETILKKCPQSRQTVLLSATVPPEVERLAHNYMRDPVMCQVSTQKEVSADTIDQYYVSVQPNRKFDLLVHLLNEEQPEQAIVFCHTKRDTDRIAKELKSKVSKVAGMHGDLPQRARDRILKKFRTGQVRCLVATDVIGRGIDISGISHVINYSIPEFCDDYVHRVGRTGRMGKSGTAYTFVSRDQGHLLTQIEKRINKLLEPAQFDGFETNPDSVDRSPRKKSRRPRRTRAHDSGSTSPRKKNRPPRSSRSGGSGKPSTSPNPRSESSKSEGSPSNNGNFSPSNGKPKRSKRKYRRAL
ncbi:DEAD-box ATP-dependent RNA helicase CshA [Planctomycetales bacterium 10988]|nr:DEAD-box ATP-dependent RNA helicase CshA [Planctomycetales bacterium 10988]